MKVKKLIFILTIGFLAGCAPKTDQIVVDESPILIADNTIDVDINDEFNLLSGQYVVAIDKEDGDISDLIELVDEVNLTEVGEYEVFFQVTDSANNTTSTSTIVTVRDRVADLADANKVLKMLDKDMNYWRVIDDIQLITSYSEFPNVTIEWSSSIPDVLTDNGTVFRPDYKDVESFDLYGEYGFVPVQLTAVVTSGLEQLSTVNYVEVVSKKILTNEDYFANAQIAFAMVYEQYKVITTDVDFIDVLTIIDQDISIDWDMMGSTIINDEGVISLDELEGDEATVTFNVIFDINDDEFTKEYTLVVRNTEEYLARIVSGVVYPDYISPSYSFSEFTKPLDKIDEYYIPVSYYSNIPDLISPWGYLNLNVIEGDYVDATFEYVYTYEGVSLTEYKDIRVYKTDSYEFSSDKATENVYNLFARVLEVNETTMVVTDGYDEYTIDGDFRDLYTVDESIYVLVFINEDLTVDVIQTMSVVDFLMNTYSQYQIIEIHDSVIDGQTSLMVEFPGYLFENFYGVEFNENLFQYRGKFLVVKLDQFMDSNYQIYYEVSEIVNIY